MTLTVAVPGGGYADAGGPALELFVRLTLVRRQRRAARFVTTVVAVWDAVTLVRLLRITENT